MAELAAFEAALREHALSVHAVVAADDEETWAAANGGGAGTLIGTLVHVAADDGTRLRMVRRTFEELVAPPAVCRVEARLTPTAGAILCTACDCQMGDVLLEVPLDGALCAADMPAAAEPRLAEDDSYGRLLVALVHLLHTQPQHVLATYCEEVFPPDEAKSLIMSLWASSSPDEANSPGDVESCEGSLAASRASGSIAWRRSRQQRARMLREWRELSAAGVVAVSAERYMWAKSLLLTRSFHLARGPTLCPLLDLANHRSLGATAQWVEAHVHGAPHAQLIARYTLDKGEEVSICCAPAPAPPPAPPPIPPCPRAFHLA